MAEQKETTEKEWTGRTGGTGWVQRSLIAGFRFLDLRFYYAIVSVVVVFYMLFNHKGYLSIYRLYRRRFHYSPVKSFFYVYRNHFAFGQIIIDRFAVYAGKRFDFEVHGQDVFDALTSAPDGFVQLGSHVGNCEIAGYLLTFRNKRFNALVYAGETETVMQNRNRVFADRNVRLIPVKSDMSHIFLLNEALADGEAVGMPADRMFGSSKSVECTFFGEKMRFPIGPFMLAVGRDVAATAFFVMKTSVKKYDIFVVRIDVDKQQPKREQIRQMAQQFASELERMVRKYPTQWFNYYEFWEQ